MLKCCAYLLSYTWTAGVWRIQIINEDELKEISIEQTEQRDNIQLLESFVSRKMLRVHIAPNGLNIKLIESLQTKAKEWGEGVKRNYSSTYDAHMSYNAALLPRVEYPIGASTISQNKYGEIMKNANGPFRF